MKKYCIYIVTILIIGCGQENIPTSSTSLNQEQAQLLAQSLLFTGIILDQDLPEQWEDSTLTGTETFTLDITNQICGQQEQGQGALTGTLTGNFDQNQASFELDHISNNCLLIDSQGMFTYDGTLQNTGQGPILEDFQTDFLIQFQGGVDITGTSVSPGTCAIDLEVRILAVTNAPIFNGNICGYILDDFMGDQFFFE